MGTVNGAKSLADSDKQPNLNIIEFFIDGEGQKQLKEMAKEFNGTYSSAANADQLNKELIRPRQQWKPGKAGCLTLSQKQGQ